MDDDNEVRDSILIYLEDGDSLPPQWHITTVPPSGRWHVLIYVFSFLFPFLVADQRSEQTPEFSNARSDCESLQDIQRLHHSAAAT